MYALLWKGNVDDLQSLALIIELLLFKKLLSGKRSLRCRHRVQRYPLAGFSYQSTSRGNVWLYVSIVYKL